MAARRSSGVIAVAVATAFLLSACVDTPEAAMDAPILIEESTEAQAPPTVTVTAPATITPVDETPDESSVDTPPQQCTTNPMASDFAPFLDQGKIPTGELGSGPGDIIPLPEVFYHFQIGENGYNSCAVLSYLVLNGSNGDAERSAGIGAAIQDAVVLFHHGELISSPAPFEMKTVEDVTRIADDQLEVHYGHAGGATAEGVTERYVFDFILTADGLTGAGELPGEIDAHLRLNLR